MAQVVRLPIPLTSNERIADSFIKRALARVDPIAIVKPGRILGAVWTSDKVARRQAVGMCEPCWRRYRGWWRAAEYHPDWGWRYLGDCDGCGTRNIHLTLFHAEEMFYTVLGPQHGRESQP